MILIVDDSTELRRVMAVLIRSEGHEVMEAGSAREALAVMRRRSPDCLILDGHMPEVDGLTLLRQIRDDATLGSPRVIFYSADRALRQQAMSAGADALVVKDSLDIDVLWRELERLGVRCCTEERFSPAPGDPSVQRSSPHVEPIRCGSGRPARGR